MATIRFLNHRNQVNNSLPSKISHGHSKAQMCLMKILHTISSFSPSNPPCSSLEHQGLEFGVRNEDRALFCGERGIGIDLNVRSCPPPEEIDYPADSEVCDEIVENLCRSDSFKEESEVVEVEDTPNDVQFRSSEFDNNGVVEETECQVEPQERNYEPKQFRGEGYMNLLIEAAKLISGGFRDDESEPERFEFVEELVVHKSAGFEPATGESANSKGLKRNRGWTANEHGKFEDTSPVVRSKRGRSRVLPYKYRDSILEPFARLSRHRSTTLSSKRRSR